VSTEPVFVNVYGAQESIPPAYVVWRAGMSNRVVVPARQAGNRFLGSLKGLQIRALISIAVLSYNISLCYTFFLIIVQFLKTKRTSLFSAIKF
jgi:hypothetical protein